MIQYSAMKRGDILKIVGEGARGYAENGELVRVTGIAKNGVLVENRDGKSMEFVYDCGAARLEATEWHDDFLDSDVAEKNERTQTDSPAQRKSEFREELCSLLNRHSRENESDTPDFILCSFLGDALNAFDRATRGRTEWYNSVAMKGDETNDD